MYALTNELETVREMAHELADNGETADQKVTLHLGFVWGPDMPAGAMAAWLNTNGGDRLLATYDATGELLYSALADDMDDEARDWALIEFGWESPADLDQDVLAFLDN